MKTEAQIWAGLLVDQKFDVPGGTVLASEHAQQLVTAFDPGTDGGIIPDLEARKLELRGIHDTRASEVADVIWRTLSTLKERAKPTESDRTGGAQGHAHAAGSTSADGPATRGAGGMVVPDEAKAGAQGHVPATPKSVAGCWRTTSTDVFE